MGNSLNGLARRLAAINVLVRLLVQRLDDEHAQRDERARDDERGRGDWRVDSGEGGRE